MRDRPCIALLPDGRWLLLPAVIVLFSAAAGWAYAELFETGRPLVSSVHAVFFGAPLLAYERGVLLPGLRSRVRRSATPLFAATSLLIFVTIFIASNALAAGLLWAAGITMRPLAEAALTPQKLAYCAAMAGLVAITFRLRDLIGPSTFVSFLLGRYHKPLREERVFMFLDLVGSTRFAEQHGDLRTLEFLGRVFEVLAGPVQRYRGSIDDYVGDMAIVTWPLGQGTRDAAVIRCLWAFLDAIERDAAEWTRRFGEVPRFRAALHCGSVVTAEIGLDRHKITYFGDVVNTTSRLEALAKALDEPVVASSDLLDRVRLPEPFVQTDLGEHVLRGRNEPLGVRGLRRPLRKIGVGG